MIKLERAGLSTDVVMNLATDPPGGIYTNSSEFAIDDESMITRNRPTNCEGSQQQVPHCFG